MGTFGLERYDTKDFNEWVTRSGYVNEYDFWSSLSSIADGTVVDHMRDYLSSLGYVGSSHDMFRQFLEGQVGGLDSVYDMATKFYEGTFSSGLGNAILDDAGFTVKDDDGNIVRDS